MATEGAARSRRADGEGRWPPGGALAACLAAGVGLALHGAVATFTRDSFEYVAVARGFAGGLGLAGRIVSVGSDGARPLDLWPPGYPIALGVLMRAGLGEVAAAVVVGVLGMVVMGGAMVGVVAAGAGLGSGSGAGAGAGSGSGAGSGAGAGAGAVVLGALGVVLYRPFAHVAEHVWSEPLALGLAALALLVDARDRRGAAVPALVAGALAGLATLTRYVAVLTLVAMMAGRLVGAWRSPRARRREVRGALLQGVGFAVVVGPWVVRSLEVFGRPLGLAHAGPAMGVKGAALAVAVGADNVIAEGTLSFVGGAVFVLGVRRLFVESAADRDEGARSGASRLLGVALLPPVHAVGILVLALVVGFDAVDARMLAPMGLGVVPVVALASASWLAGRPPGERRLVLGVAAFGIAATSLVAAARLVAPRGLERVRTRSDDAAVVAWAGASTREGDLLAGHGVALLEPFTRATLLTDGYREHGTLDGKSLAAFLARTAPRWRAVYWIGRAGSDPPPGGEGAYTAILVASPAPRVVYRITPAR